MCSFFIVITIVNYLFIFIELVTDIVKYINFKYIILAPPIILVKIRHCLQQGVYMPMNGQLLYSDYTMYIIIYIIYIIF